MKYKGRRALVVGVGKSGLAAARFLTRQGADVIATDLKKHHELLDAHIQLDKLGIYQEFGGYNRHTFLASDLIVLSPGVDPNGALIREAVHKGVEIVNEPELAFREITVPVIAITGSNGKTTTTALVGEILKASGHRVFVGGNIGIPLLDFIDSSKGYDIVVAELSSYQIELIASLKPAAAVFTNISQNHLDRYKTMDRYTAAKRHLRELCNENSVVVLNADDPVISQFTAANKLEERTFSTLREDAWIYSNGNQIQTASGVSFDLSKYELPGRHNVENLMAAIASVWNIAHGFGATAPGIELAIRSFKGVPHRIQYVRTVRGVRYYNDSKSTTVQSLLTCVSGFSDGINIVLMGGRDKGSDYRILSDALNQKCRAAIAYGEAAALIAAQLQTGLTCPFEICVDLNQAVAKASSIAQVGDNVLLSPACASQDQFTDFEHRGRVFTQLVETLDEAP